MKPIRFFNWLPLLAPVLLAACASTSSEKLHPYWPQPPDEARFIYESVIRSEFDIIRQTKTEFFRSQVAGFDGRTQSAFLKPYDVAARGGRILVSDSSGGIVSLFNIPAGQLFRIGRGEKGKIEQPSGVTIDSKGRLYVADIKSRHVVMYNEVGHFLRIFGGPEIFSKPTDVAVTSAGDRIFVTDVGGIDSDQHRVVAFNASGAMQFTIGKHGAEAGEFHLPSHIAVGPGDNLFVLDAGNFRVQVFDKDGKFLRMWGKLGINIGDLARPRGIAVDQDGNVYITDGKFGNFQVFTPEGQLLMWIGNTGLEDKPGQYALPAGIAVDETQRVYVVDQMYNKVEVLRRLSDEESARLAKNLPLLKKPAAENMAPLAPSKSPKPSSTLPTMPVPVARNNNAAPPL